MISDSVFSDNYADVAGGAVGFESNSPRGLSSDAGGGLYLDPPSGPAIWTNQVRAQGHPGIQIWDVISGSRSRPELGPADELVPVMEGEAFHVPS